MGPFPGGVRSRVFDVALAAAITAIDLGGSIGEAHPRAHTTAAEQAWINSHPPGAFYALVVLAGLALAGRRRWPIPVLAVVVAFTAAYAGAGFVPGAALVAVYVSLYTVASIQSRGRAITSGAVAAVVLFVATGAGGPFGWLGGTNTVMVACVIAAVAIGMAVAGRRQVFVTMKERAERAERDREEEARRRVDAERLRIARELHDVVAHTMSMINVQAGVAAHVLSDHPEEAAEALSAIRIASREGLRELRAILNVLRQVDIGDGTAPAPRLAQLAALVDATAQAGLVASLRFEGERPVDLPESLELAAYRIVQESLTNVLRHAGPDARAWVTVAFEPGRVVVQVDDDGQPAPVTTGGALAAAAPSAGGAPAGSAAQTSPGPAAGTPSGGAAGRAATAAGGSGAGLSGMRERASAFGGTVKAGPRPGGGWRVRAVLVIPGAPA